MAREFKHILKDIYKWQLSWYLPTPKLVPLTSPTAPTLCFPNCKYFVLKWHHPQMDNLWLNAETSETYQDSQPIIPCDEDHIERLLCLIHNHRYKGLSFALLHETLKAQSNVIDRQILDNLQMMLEHLTSIGMIVQLPIGAYYQLNNKQFIHEPKLFDKFINELKIQPTGDFQLDELKIILSHSYIKQPYGFTFDQLVDDLNYGNNYLYIEISKNLAKLIVYALRHEYLIQIESI